MAYGKWKPSEELTVQAFGYSIDEITEGSHKPIKVVCEVCNTVANKRVSEATRQHRCALLLNGEKHCFKCKTFKAVSEFSKNRSRKDGLQKVCKQCFAEYDCVKQGYVKKTNGFKSDLNKYFAALTSSVKCRSKKLGLPFDLDGKFLMEQFEKQNGKCYYSGMTIEHNTGLFQSNSISVDRRTPAQGYVKNNVVLCSFAINSFKGSLSEFEFVQLLREILPALTEFHENK